MKIKNRITSAKFFRPVRKIHRIILRINLFIFAFIDHSDLEKVLSNYLRCMGDVPIWNSKYENNVTDNNSDSEF